jgi:hypothetical protein
VATEDGDGLWWEVAVLLLAFAAGLAIGAVL